MTTSIMLTLVVCSIQLQEQNLSSTSSANPVQGEVALSSPRFIIASVSKRTLQNLEFKLPLFPPTRFAGSIALQFHSNSVLRYCKSAWPLAPFFFYNAAILEGKSCAQNVSASFFFFFLSWWKLLTCCKNSIQSLSVKVSYPGCFSWIMYKSVPLKVYIS